MKNLKHYIQTRAGLPTMRIRAGLTQEHVDTLARTLSEDMESTSYAKMSSVIRELEKYCWRYQLEKPKFS